MTNKTKKEIQAENNKLKESLDKFQIKCQKLSEKCDLLESEKKQNFKCQKCSKKSENVNNLKGHLKKQKELPSTEEIYKCSECEKQFNEEWKINAHMKMHKKYECDKCEKKFKYLDIKIKHIQVQHEKAKLYCHFYNNNKTCAYNDECVFLHEDSKPCKYGVLCERNYCMFKHQNNDDIQVKSVLPEDVGNEKDVIENSECDEEVEIAVNEDIVRNVLENNVVTADDTVEIIDVDDVDETNENENSNKTFNNPSQVDKNFHEEFFKCEICDFASARKDTIVNHKELLHNWCPQCYSSFNNQMKLRSHIRNIHCDK